MTKSAKRLATEKAYYLKRMANPEYRKVQAIRYKKWYQKNGTTPERLAKKAKQMRAYAKNPHLRFKHIARGILNKAIHWGKITKQPCEVCGKKRVQAHHKDYSKPLEVIWLCRKHHRQIHAKAEATNE